MASVQISIPPDRFVWAIERNGSNVPQFCAKYPNTQKWIDGDTKPTIKQVQDFAKRVNVPFGYMFLKNTPQEKLPVTRFRKTNEATNFDLATHDIVRKIKLRQEWLEEFIVARDLERFAYNNAIKVTANAYRAADMIRQALNIEADFATKVGTIGEAMNKLTEHIENIGIFTCSTGIIENNTHRPISVDECRGFALASNVAPYIFVNSSDAKGAQMFTLAHELTHIFMGISASHTGDIECDANETERFCDSVAAEFLVPEKELLKKWNKDIEATAKKFKVSDIVIARRAHDVGLIDDDTYRQFFANRKVVRKETTKGGGDFYVVSKKRVGKSFARYVKYAVSTGDLSYVEAYRQTGLWGSTYDRFMKEI